MRIQYEQGAVLGEPDTDLVNRHKRSGQKSHKTRSHQHTLNRNITCGPFTKLSPENQLMDTMFIVGGWTQTAPSCPVERFCPLYNEWRSVAPMINRRGDVSVCSLDGMIFTIGGRDDITCVSTVEKYDPNMNLWNSEVKSLSGPRSGVCSVEMDGFIYALGGFDGVSCTNIVERYDPELDIWTKMTSMRQHRSGAAAAVLDGYLYVMGGTDGDTPLNSVERFNPLEGTWQPCPPMRSARERPGCTVYLGQIYLAGGRDELHMELNTAERFDAETLKWTPVKRMRHKRYQVSLTLFGGMLLAVGGSDGTSTLRTIEAYNPDSDSWRHFGCMKSKHTGGGVVLLKTQNKDLL